MAIRFSTSITIGGKRTELPPVQPSAASGKANSIFCPLGPAPTMGWFVMVKRYLDELNVNSPLTVVWSEIEKQDDDLNPDGTVQVSHAPTTRSLSFPGLYIVKTQRLFQGAVADSDALHLVTLADSRFIADGTSDTGAIVSNARSYANDADFLTGTNTYTTWSLLVNALWSACGDLGAYPGLPTTLPVDGAPNNHWLVGLNAYRTLNAVLDQLDCAICHNPLTNIYTLVQLGSTQTLTSSTGNARLKWDGEPKSPNTKIASYLNIYHPKHYKSYGQERDTELATNWALSGFHKAYQVATSITGAIGTQSLWDDLPVILDENNEESNTDDDPTLSEITARNTNRLSRYLTRNNMSNRHRIYTGLLNDFLPAGFIKAVMWRDLGDGKDNALGGTVTEYVCSSDLVTGVSNDNGNSSWTYLDKSLASNERLPYSPFDLGRNTFPNYPRLANIVQVHKVDDSQGSTTSAGDTIDPDKENLDGVKFHLGKVARFVSGTVTTLNPCYILFVDNYDTNKGNVQAIQDDYYGPARLSGVTTCSDVLLPVYTVRNNSGPKNGSLIVFELIEKLELEGSALAFLCRLNTVTGEYITTSTYVKVVDFYRNFGEWQGLAGYRGFASKRTDNITIENPVFATDNSVAPTLRIDKYDVVWMERPALLTYGTLEAADGLSILPNGTPSALSLVSFQQGNKTPPNSSIVFDPGALYPLTTGPGPAFNSNPSTGSNFISAWNDRSLSLEYLVAQQQTFYIRATLLGPLEATDNTARVTNVRTEMFSPFNQDPKDNNANGMLVRNDYNHIGVKDAGVFLMWMQTVRQWLIIFVEPTYLFGFVRAIADPAATPTSNLKKLTGTATIDALFTPSMTSPVSLNCFVRFADFNSPNTINKDHIIEYEKFYMGKLVAFKTVGANKFPVYEACVGEQEFLAKCTAKVEKDAEGTFELIDGDDNPTGIMITAKAKYKACNPNKGIIVKRFPGSVTKANPYIAQQAEC